MNKPIKLLITEDINAFTDEDLNIIKGYNILPEFCNNDGEELLLKIMNESPDVVIMNLFMTRLDSLGVMRMIKQKKVKSPIIIVTASFNSPALEREIMTSGASYYALKPYNINAIC